MSASIVNKLESKMFSHEKLPTVYTVVFSLNNLNDKRSFILLLCYWNIIQCQYAVWNCPPPTTCSYRGNALGNVHPIGSDENLFILKFYGQLFFCIHSLFKITTDLTQTRKFLLSARDMYSIILLYVSTIIIRAIGCFTFTVASQYQVHNISRPHPFVDFSRVFDSPASPRLALGSAGKPWKGKKLINKPVLLSVWYRNLFKIHTQKMGNIDVANSCKQECESREKKVTKTQSLTGISLFVLFNT